jgi:hypothetical protein
LGHWKIRILNLFRISIFGFRICLTVVTQKEANDRRSFDQTQKETVEFFMVSAPGSRPRFGVAGWGYAPVYQNSGQLGAGGSGVGGPGGNVGPSLE